MWCVLICCNAGTPEVLWAGCVGWCMTAPPVKRLLHDLARMPLRLRCVWALECAGVCVTPSRLAADLSLGQQVEADGRQACTRLCGCGVLVLPLLAAAHGQQRRVPTSRSHHTMSKLQTNGHHGACAPCVVFRFAKPLTPPTRVNMAPSPEPWTCCQHA